jgi:hypothetical protein
MAVVNDNLRSSLEKALQENWSHARHVENLRDRYMALYWFLWAAILSYVGRQGDFETGIKQSAFLFALLTLMSLAVLFSTLKWNSEFANHMAAAAATATALDLNRSNDDQKRASNTPLAYPEFKGYMALPLKFPIPYNAGVWLALTHCLGLGLATTLCLRAWCGWKLSVLAGALAGIAAIALCYKIYAIAQREISTRLPDQK